MCESPPQSRLVSCYPLRLALPSPPLPRVEPHFENDMACLRFKGEMVKVNRGHFSKLVGVFQEDWAPVNTSQHHPSRLLMLRLSYVCV